MIEHSTTEPSTLARHPPHRTVPVLAPPEWQDPALRRALLAAAQSRIFGALKRFDALDSAARILGGRALDLGVPRPYVDAWRPHLQRRQREQLTELCAFLDPVADHDDLAALSSRWRSLDPRVSTLVATAWHDVIRQDRPHAPQGEHSLYLALLETVVSPMILLGQSLFEALPREVPDLSDTALSLGSEQALLPLEPWLVELSAHLGYRYRHLPLYATRDVQLIPHSEVHTTGTDRRTHLHGLRPTDAQPGLVFRVSRPWYEALGDASPPPPARVCIFRHEPSPDATRA